MALTINSVTMPNPVTVDVDSVPLVASNVAYGGLRSYYHSQSTTNKQTLHVIKIAWDNLHADELSDVTAAWQAACDAYVTLTMTDIDLPATTTVDDEFSVIVYPGTALSVDYMQAYDGAGNGPILYTVSATFVTGPLLI